MDTYITYDELSDVVDLIYEYMDNPTKIQALRLNRGLLENARNIDMSIRSKEELEKDQFIPTHHKPTGLAVKEGNFLGESYLEDGELTIYDDDQSLAKSSHINTYILKLHEPETHRVLYSGNSSSQNPYDFDTEFVSQITYYKDSDTYDDTTSHAWESFPPPYKSKGYRTPSRWLEYKTPLWQQGGLHRAQYVIKIDEHTGEVQVYDANGVLKQSKFKPNPKNAHYLADYLDHWARFRAHQYKNYPWSYFLV